MKVICVCCSIATLMVLLSVSAHAQSSLVLYDDFSAPLLDPARWFGTEPGQTTGLEAVRVRSINQDNNTGQLHLAYRSYGSTHFDGGTQGAFLSLFFTNPANVTAVQATVQVNKLMAIGCATPNSAPTSARAQITGRFFNTGTPVNDIGDVAATIEISQFSNETVLRVSADVFQCTVTPCSQGTSFGHLDFGTFTVGGSARLLIQWDQPHHQFIFQRDNRPLAFVPYTVSDKAPPFGQFKTLDIFTDVANCTASPRPVGFADAFYSNVFINASAVP